MARISGIRSALLWYLSWTSYWFCCFKCCDVNKRLLLSMKNIRTIGVISTIFRTHFYKMWTLNQLFSFAFVTLTLPSSRHQQRALYIHKYILWTISDTLSWLLYERSITLRITQIVFIHILIKNEDKTSQGNRLYPILPMVFSFKCFCENFVPKITLKQQIDVCCLVR